MVDEVRAVLGSGKVLKVGDESWAIRDPDVPIQLIELVTEARIFNGIAYMSFAHTIIDGGNAGEAVICSRLRMNLAVAQTVHSILGNMIADALKPADISKAN